MSAQSTWKKSTASMLMAWVRRNCRQRRSGRWPSLLTCLLISMRVGSVSATNACSLLATCPAAHRTGGSTTASGAPRTGSVDTGYLELRRTLPTSALAAGIVVIFRAAQVVGVAEFSRGSADYYGEAH